MTTTTTPRGRTQAPSTQEPERPLGTAPSLRAFFGLTFLLGWGTGIAMVLFQDPIETVFGEIGYTNPVFIFLVYSPALSGMFLVWRHYGTRGVVQFLRRLTLWRMPARWWALLIGIPVLFYAGAAIAGTLGEPFPFSPWYGVFPALALTLIIGPVEELGWRGVALPLLQRRHTPLVSSLIVGSVWAVWHLPAFFMSGTKQEAWDLAPFLIGVVALAVILTPMFNASAGSLLIPALFHFQMNGDAWPDGQPWDMYLFAVMAIVIFLLNRKAMLTRDGAVTDIVPAGTSHER